MSPAPRIGSGRSIQEFENKKAKAAMAEEITREQAAALEDEKAAEVARLRATSAQMNPTPAPRPSLADLLAKASGADKLAALDAAERDGQRDAEADDRTRAQEMIRPFKEAGHRAITRMGIIKAKHGDRVAKAAALDLKAILKRVPEQIVPGLDYTPNHFAITQYIELARDLAQIFLVFKPVDFADALRGAESTIYRGTSSLEFQNEIRRHLPWHTERLTNLGTGVEEKLARLDQLEAQITADLADVTLLDVAPEPKLELLPAMQPTPARGETSSFVDFDPREPAPRPSSSDPEVTRLGAEGEGVRVGSLGNIREKNDKAVIVGVAQEAK